MKDIPAGLLEEVVKKLVDGLSPEKIILFGSHAYGNPDENSDIDLMIIISESDEPRYRRASKAYSYLWGITAPVELVVLTRQEIKQGLNVITSLASQAIRHGKLLYERSKA